MVEKFWKLLLGLFVVSFLFNCEKPLKGSAQELRALAEKKINLAKKVSSEEDLKDADFVKGNDSFDKGLAQLNRDKSEDARKSFSGSIVSIDKFLDKKKPQFVKGFFDESDSFLEDFKGTLIESWPKGVYDRVAEINAKWRNAFQDETQASNITDDDLANLADDYDFLKRYGYLKNYKEILASRPEVDADALEALKKLSEAEDLDVPSVFPSEYQSLLDEVGQLNEDLKRKDNESFIKRVGSLLKKIDQLIEMANSLRKISEYNLKAVRDLKAELVSLWEELASNGGLPSEQVEEANNKTMMKMMGLVERSSKLGLVTKDAYKAPPQDR